MRIGMVLALLLLPWVYSKAQQTGKIRLDLANAMGGNVAQIFEEVKYIPLESTKESLFGKIDQLEVTDQFFIILDRETNAVLLFSKEGKFLKKIKGKKMEIQYFRYYKETEQIVVAYYDRNKLIADYAAISASGKSTFDLFLQAARYMKLYTYQADEALTQQVSFLKKLSLTGNIAVGFGGNYSVLYDKVANAKFPDSVLFELSVFKGSKLRKQYLPYNLKKSVAANGHLSGMGSKCDFFASSSDSLLYFTHAFDYTVYALSPDSLVPYKQLVFPANYTVPASYFSDTALDEGKKIAYLRAHPDFVTHISRLAWVNSNLFLELNHTAAVNSNLLYSTQSGNLYDYFLISPDSTNCFLPIANQYKMDVYSVFDQSHVFTSISSLEMFQAKQSNEYKHPVYPAALHTYFEESDKNSNPVIIMLKPNTNL